jgi:hypothetical protein
MNCEQIRGLAGSLQLARGGRSPDRHDIVVQRTVVRRRAIDKAAGASWPDAVTTFDDRYDPPAVEKHRVASIRRELAFWPQLTMSPELEPISCSARERHSTESDPSVALLVLGPHNLIRRQRYPEMSGEDHESAGRTVANDCELRGSIRFAMQRGPCSELDDQ